MKKNTAVLTAKKRDRVGSRYARRVRAAGGLPAALYGHGADPVAITLDNREASRRLHAGEKVFTLKMDGDADQVALLKELQFDYLGDTIIHADFVRVDLDEQVEVHVAVHLAGDAVGLKTAGSVLLHPVSELTVRCRVTEIPDAIHVDVSALEVGKSIHVSEIKAPEGVTILTDPDAVVATIHVNVEQPTAEAAAAEGGPAEPEVIREKKPDAAEGDAKEKKKG